MSLLFAIWAAGCSDNNKPGPSSPGRDDGNNVYLLKEEPSGAKTVQAARKECRDGDDVVVIGRIGGDAKPWIDGRAGFWIVDESLKTCIENQEECPTPWDYCHVPKEELRKYMTTVKFVDEEGRTVPVDARQLLGVKEMQKVVVKGRAKCDEQGNLSILATGLYIRQ
jgi:hypothetical protein